MAMKEVWKDNFKRISYLLIYLHDMDWMKEVVT